MLISPASAAHFTPPTGSAGGGIALLVILGIVVALFVANRARKNWHKRKLPHDDGTD